MTSRQHPAVRADLGDAPVPSSRADVTQIGSAAPQNRPMRPYDNEACRAWLMQAGYRVSEDGPVGKNNVREYLRCNPDVLHAGPRIS